MATNTDESDDIENMTSAELRAYDEARSDDNEEIAATWIEPPVHGKKDPDGMNIQRTEWGMALVAKMQELTNTDQEDAVCDAICDLLHAAGHMGQDPAEQLRRAISHFNAETSEG